MFSAFAPLIVVVGVLEEDEATDLFVDAVGAVVVLSLVGFRGEEGGILLSCLVTLAQPNVHHCARFRTLLRPSRQSVSREKVFASKGSCAVSRPPPTTTASEVVVVAKKCELHRGH